MVQYHFRTKEGPSLGPIGAEEFRQRVDAGDIADDTAVWRSGMLDWTTYADLRAFEERAAQPPPLPASVPPPLPVQAKESHHAAARPAVQFLACGTCGQDWPEHLLTVQGPKPICGNCIRREGENAKYGKLQNKATAVSSGWGKWLLKTVGLGAFFCGFIFVRMLLRHEAHKGNQVLRYQINAKEHSFRQLPTRYEPNKP